MLLPILAGLELAPKVNPLLLMIPATRSCSFAFTLLVANPPNAIVFGAERLSIRDMASAGFLLNLIGELLITLAVLLLGRLVFDIQAGTMPQRAVPH